MIAKLSRFLETTPLILIVSYGIILLAGMEPLFYQHIVGVFNGKETQTFAWYALYSFGCFFILPFLFSRLLHGETRQTLCIQPPLNMKVSIYLIIASLALLLPYIYVCSRLPVFQGYSYGTRAFIPFLFMQITLDPIYYFGEEFFFRGFLFMRLWRNMGWHSFWVTDIVFVIAHFGKPGAEVLLCIPASLILSYLTLKTRSIYPSVIVHSTLGIFLNILVTFYPI